MEKEKTPNAEDVKAKEIVSVGEEAQEYYEAESWQFSSCGD